MNPVIQIRTGLVLLVLVSACTTPEQKSLLDEPTPLPLVNARQSQDLHLFQLNDEMVESFYTYYHDPVNAPTPEHERVANYLSIIIDRFEYTENTNIARDALNSMTGNCLSLAMITSAYARLADVPIRFQLLGSNPVFELEQDLLIKTDHIRSVLSGKWERGGAFDLRRDIRIDYFPTDNLSYVDHFTEAELISMYYNNKAVESMQANELSNAFELVRRSLSISNDNAAALNTLAILHRRNGDLDKAEEIYLDGMQKYPDALSFTRNYAQLLKRQGRDHEAWKLEARLKAKNERNPWRWVLSAQSHERASSYENAVRDYHRALEIQEDLHQVHLYLGIAYYKLGNDEASKHHLAKAVEYSKDDQSRGNYKRKLWALD